MKQNQIINMVTHDTLQQLQDMEWASQDLVTLGL